MVFRIDWRVDKETWDWAREIAQLKPSWATRSLDRELGLQLPLMGEIQFRHGGQVLYPVDRLHQLDEKMRDKLVDQGGQWNPVPDASEILGNTASLIGLSCDLMEIKEAFLSLLTNQTVSYRDVGGALWISFEKRGSVVTVTSWYHDIELVIPIKDFLSEVARFLVDFVTTMQDEVPQLLEWPAFASFTNFARPKR